jgi:two-component system phosphate regulon sensor histidine kinase PhoR
MKPVQDRIWETRPRIGANQRSWGSPVATIAGARANNRQIVRFFLLAQAPLLLTLAVLAVILCGIDPALVVEPAFLSGIALALITTAGALLLRHKRSRYAWIVIVPLSDIVVVALAREGMHVMPGTVPSLGALIIFPVLWLASELRLSAFPAVFAASTVVVGLPYVLRGELPDGPVAWFNAVLVPVALGCVSLGVGFVVRRMREDRQRADELALRLQDSLAETADRELTLRSVTETVEAAIVLFDPLGKIVLRNGTARAMFSLGGADTEGNFVTPPLLFGEDRITLVPLEGSIAASALRGDPTAGRIFWIGPPGAQRAITVASRHVTRAGGGSLGTVLVGYDVTPLVESIEIRDDFLASVSHELKTPLTNIIGYLDLLGESSAATEIAVIQKNAVRLMGLVADLLTGAGATQQVHRIPVDLTAIAEAAITQIQSYAHSAGIGVRLSRGARVVAEVDRDAVRRVIDNLLSNGVKYSRAGTQIVVAVTEEDGSAVVTVRDSGAGISREHLSRVFDRFFRAPSARSQAIPGTGLGLAIVRALVEAHDGTVDVESEPGTGSVFTVRLPLRALATAG